MHLCTCFSKVQSSLFGILLVTPLLSRLGLGAVISDLNRVKPLLVDGQKTPGAALVSKHLKRINVARPRKHQRAKTSVSCQQNLEGQGEVSCVPEATAGFP
jgi:hypothetical protein